MNSEKNFLSILGKNYEKRLDFIVLLGYYIYYIMNKVKLTYDNIQLHILT